MTSTERTLIEVVAFLLLIGGFALWERHKGAADCKQADIVAVQKQETHDAAKAAADTKTINTEAQTYAQTLADPAPIDAPHVSLCHYTPSAVPSASSPGSSPHEASPSRIPDPSHIDIGPPLVKVGVDSDAQVRGLQDYIAKVCLIR